MNLRTRLAAPLLALALAAAAPAWAGTDPSAVVGPPAGPPLSGDALIAETNAVSKHLRCPVCQGLSVADSPSESAKAMKDEVQDLVAKGYDQDQVLDYFEASYGEFIRLEPKAEGWNLLVWVAPGLALVGGLGWVAMTMRRRGAATPSADTEPEVVDPALAPYLAQVHRDVGDGR